MTKASEILNKLVGTIDEDAVIDATDKRSALANSKASLKALDALVTDLNPGKEHTLNLPGLPKFSVIRQNNGFIFSFGKPGSEIKTVKVDFNGNLI